MISCSSVYRILVSPSIYFPQSPNATSYHEDRDDNSKRSSLSLLSILGFGGSFGRFFVGDGL